VTRLLFTFCSAFALSAASTAGAAHPALEACGGMKAERAEGVRVNAAVSKKLEDVIERFLKDADIAPGAAVAIVKGDKIVYARGFGFRDLAGCKPALSDTRFYLKSTTKSFTGMMAAILHEEGAIELDAPISEYLPDLALPQGVNAAQASLRSHFTHTQPYFDAGNNYRTSSPGNLPESEYVAHANAFSVPKDIRFRYSNFGPIMGAHAISVKTGTSRRELLATRVFAPAGMTSTFASVTEAEKGPATKSYLGADSADFSETLTKTESQMHAAGGSYSTAADLGRWLIINLNGGMIDGKQALPKRAVEQVQARQVQLATTYSEFKRFAHGLGLYSADYEGDVLMHHFGGETHVSFMPEQRLGVAVLANEISNGALVTHRLAATIYDMLLEKKDIDARVKRRLDEIAAAKTRSVEQRAQYLAELNANAPKGERTYTAAALAGRYVDPRLGEIVIERAGDTLSMRYGDLDGPLAYVSGDAYLADFQMWGDPPELFVFRKDKELGEVLDWGGRIFVRQKN
jgi:CubicO group peptidase (beta-lactamase class C family)